MESGEFLSPNQQHQSIKAMTTITITLNQ